MWATRNTMWATCNTLNTINEFIVFIVFYVMWSGGHSIPLNTSAPRQLKLCEFVQGVIVHPRYSSLTPPVPPPPVAVTAPQWVPCLLLEGPLLGGVTRPEPPPPYLPVTPVTRLIKIKVP